MTQKVTKGQLITGIVSFIILFSALFYGLYSKNIKKRALEANPEYGWAIIDKIVYSKTSSIKYHFEVDGKRYTGSSGHKNDSYIILGDTCQVLYSSVDPEYSQLVRDEEGILKLKRFTGVNPRERIFKEYFDEWSEVSD